MLFIACHLALMSGNVGIADSGFFQIQDQVFRREADAVRIVKSIVTDHCGQAPEIQNSHCKNIIGSVNASKVCYLETNVGYFFVSKSSMEDVNVIFNRWD